MVHLLGYCGQVSGMNCWFSFRIYRGFVIAVDSSDAVVDDRKISTGCRWFSGD